MAPLGRTSGSTLQTSASPLSEEVLDRLLANAESTLKQMERSRSSLVHFPRAELEMLKIFGSLRDFMITLLHSERGDRVALRGIFGGDCERICKIRAICEVIRLSEAARGDQRVASCLDACKIVETVLQDLGLGFALKRAQDAHLLSHAETRLEQPLESLDGRCSSSEAPPNHADLQCSEASSPGVREQLVSQDVFDLSGLEQSVHEPESIPESEPSPEQELSPGVRSWELQYDEEDDRLSDGALDEEFARLVKATKLLLSDVAAEEPPEALSEPLPEPETTNMAIAMPSNEAEWPSPAEKNSSHSDCEKEAPAKTNNVLVHSLSHSLLTAAPVDADATCTDVDIPRMRNNADLYSLLSLEHQSLIRELFLHYVGPGGLSAGTGLGLSKFRSCLRDCGLLREDACLEANRTVLDEMALLLSSSQADLILARAAGATSSRSGMTQKLRTVESFARALAEVAVHVSPELAPMPDQALDVFCEEILEPLASRVLQGVLQYVRSAVNTLGERDVALILRRCQKGLSAIFAKYASAVGASEPYRRGHWTMRMASRFAVDARLAADLSLAQLQQLFVACASHEASFGRGMDEKLSFDCFLLALVATSLCIYETSKWSSAERLARLLYKISDSLPGHHDIVTVSRMYCSRRGSLR